MDALIEKHRRAILELAQIYNVQEMRLFGSRARGDARPDSDADFLADMSHLPFFQRVEFCDRLEDLLGVEVDILNEKHLKPRALHYILSDATPL